MEKQTIETLRTVSDSELAELANGVARRAALGRAFKTDAELQAAMTEQAIEDCVEDALDSLPRQFRKDAVSGLFVERLVRGGINAVFRHEFPARKWVNGGLVPLDMSLSDGAVSWDYQEIEAVGQAGLIGHDSTDVPMATITGKSHNKEIHVYGIGYRYTRQEMRMAALQGRYSISQERAIAAREGNDTTLNSLIFEGDAKTGSTGIINTPGTTHHTAATAGWDSTASAAQIIEAFGQAYDRMLSDSDGVEMPDTFITSIPVFSRMKRLPMSQDNSQTVLSYLQANYPGITVWDWAPEMATGDLARTGDAALLYNRSPSRLRAMLPMRMRPTPPEARGLGWSVLFESAYGGLLLQRPKSVMIIDNVG